MTTQAARYVRVANGFEKYHTLKSPTASYIFFNYDVELTN